MTCRFCRGSGYDGQGQPCKCPGEPTYADHAAIEQAEHDSDSRTIALRAELARSAERATIAEQHAERFKSARDGLLGENEGLERKLRESAERVSHLKTTLEMEATLSKQQLEVIYSLRDENRRLRSLLDGFRYNGCFTGDCTHETSMDCIEDLRQYSKEVDEGLQSRQVTRPHPYADTCSMDCCVGSPCLTEEPKRGHCPGCGHEWPPGSENVRCAKCSVCDCKWVGGPADSEWACPHGRVIKFVCDQNSSWHFAGLCPCKKSKVTQQDKQVPRPETVAGVNGQEAGQPAKSEHVSDPKPGATLEAAAIAWVNEHGRSGGSSWHTQRAFMAGGEWWYANARYTQEEIDEAEARAKELGKVLGVGEQAEPVVIVAPPRAVDANRYEVALHSIVARSHAWVIRRETSAIEMPIHESYRAIAQKALAKPDSGGSHATEK